MRVTCSRTRASDEARALLQQRTGAEPERSDCARSSRASGWSGSQSTGDADSGVLSRPQPSTLSRRALRESIAASRAALALRPNYAEAWNNIGAAYNKLGRYEEAAAACEEALRFKPDFELARNNLKYAREKLKERLDR